MVNDIVVQQASPGFELQRVIHSPNRLCFLMIFNFADRRREK